MSKAHQAPPAHRPRYRYVAEHAIERLRERVQELDADHRSDLVPWLDEMVEQAIRRGDVRVLNDRGAFARLADITSDLGTPAFAVVKANERADSDFSEAVVTILEESMVQKYQDSNRWQPVGTLAEKLAGVTLAPPTPRKAAHRKTPPPVAEPPPKLVAVPPAVAPDEIILIEYERADGSTVFEKVAREDLQDRLLALAIELGQVVPVHFWRKTAAQARHAVIIEGL